jgi:hypothetical protein
MQPTGCVTGFERITIAMGALQCSWSFAVRQQDQFCFAAGASSDQRHLRFCGDLQSVVHSNWNPRFRIFFPEFHAPGAPFDLGADLRRVD